MPPETRDRPDQTAGATRKTDGDHVTGTSLADLAEMARDLVTEADCAPPCDLVAWAEGFTAGYDAAMSGAIHVKLLDLAEAIARHDQQQWVAVGAFSRQRRIEREVAEGAKRARPVQDAPGWPRVRVPGGEAS